MTAPLLETRGLCAGYGSVEVIHDIDLTVHTGEVVALIGPNGAGKSTMLRALAGELPARAGSVLWQGQVVTSALHQRARRGLGYVPEERSIVTGLTARQNLRLGRVDPARAIALFPEIEEHLDRSAGLLSGGQQQIVTLARILARDPTVLIADELSLGLAPQIVTRLLNAVRAAADNGTGVLLVEQHMRKVLQMADRVCFVQHGRISWTGSAVEAVQRRQELEAHYLSGGRDHAP